MMANMNQRITSAHSGRRFWRPARGKQGILFYLILIHAMTILGLVLFPAPGLRVAAAALLLTGLGGLGTTVCYHRALAHRALRLHPVVEQVLTFFAMFNGSGAPASWVAYHRHHHAHTDTPADISSPVYGGFWWAHLGWLYQAPRADPARWAPELNKGARRLWRYAEVPVLALSILCGLPFGWAAFFWLGSIRLVYSLHMQCFVNSLTHLGKVEDGDASQNVWWLGPLQLTAWGENWHKNHHSNAGCARLGWRPWQVDVGWYFIRVMEVLRLATAVRRLPARSQTR